MVGRGTRRAAASQGSSPEGRTRFVPALGRTRSVRHQIAASRRRRSAGARGRERGGPTRSHPEPGRDPPQRRRVLGGRPPGRRGRRGRRPTAVPPAPRPQTRSSMPRGGAVAARWAHNPKVGGSNPPPATHPPAAPRHPPPAGGASRLSPHLAEVFQRDVLRRLPNLGRRFLMSDRVDSIRLRPYPKRPSCCVGLRSRAISMSVTGVITGKNASKSAGANIGSNRTALSRSLRSRCRMFASSA